MHAHHVNHKGGDGGTGLKVSDSDVVPLCDLAHEEVHRGKLTFERKYGVDLVSSANNNWRASPHKSKWMKQ